jgi:hypothetical protein
VVQNFLRETGATQSRFFSQIIALYRESVLPCSATKTPLELPNWSGVAGEIGVQEVGGSNPPAPTDYKKGIRQESRMPFFVRK